MSISLNMTADDDNKVIWIVKITVDASTIYYLADEDITLSSQLYDGKVLHKDTIGNIKKNSEHYGIGSVGNFTFGVARYNSYTGLSNFFNDLYPATSGDYLVGAKVEFGIVWEGATTEAEITYLQEFYVEDYEYNYDYMTLFCTEIAELESKQLPYYEVQSDYDDGVSYFANAPEDSLGANLPIVYGEFYVDSFTNYMADEVIRTPTVVVDEGKMTAVIAYHKCNLSSSGVHEAGQYSIYRWVNDLGIYQILYRTAGTDGKNNYSGYHVSMMDDGTVLLLGKCYIKLRVYSPESDEAEVGEATNPTLTDYVVVDAGNVLALRIGRDGNEGNFGFVSEAAASDIQCAFRIASDDVNNRDWNISLVSNLSSPQWSSATGTSGTHTLGTVGENKTHNMASDHPPSLPWTIERLCATEYLLANNEASEGDDIRCYYGYVYCENINALGISKNYKIVKVQLQRFG